MNKYEVIIDFESKHLIVEAKNEEKAETIAIKEYEKIIKKGKQPMCEHYWVGDCYEMEE
jgi:hypothetical protein